MGKVPDPEISREYKLKQESSYLKKYGLYLTKDVPHKINCFAQIGFPDPYPNEKISKSKMKKPSEIDELVYAPHRYV